jgi:hypothetical protein
MEIMLHIFLTLAMSGQLHILIVVLALSTKYVAAGALALVWTLCR